MTEFEVYRRTRNILLIAMTIIVAILMLVLYMRLFIFGYNAGNTIIILVITMVLTIFCFVLTMSLLSSNKYKNSIVFKLNEADESTHEKESDLLYEKLQKEIDMLKDGLSNIGPDDVVKLQKEKSKDVAFSRIKYHSRNLKKKITAVCGYFEKPMQYSLYFSIAFAVAGLAPLGYLAIKENADYTVSSISSIFASKWHFFCLTLVFEFVSGIFLKIYYKLVDEIKYYIDENARVTRSAVALETLILLDRLEKIDELTIKMIETKKNRVLKKGESTEEIEKQKCNKPIDNSNLLSLVEMILKNNEKKQF